MNNSRKLGAGVCEWSIEMDHVGFLRMTNKHIIEKELLSDFEGTGPPILPWLVLRVSEWL
jgi:hypothetical protein